MRKVNRKKCLRAYLMAAVLISFYIHVGAESIEEYIGTSLLTLFFFIAIWLCLRKITNNGLFLVVVRLLAALLFLILIYCSWTFAHVRQFNTQGCKHDLAGKNKFTQRIERYCNFVPWYANVV